MPIPAPDISTTPTPRTKSEDAWRYNEDADIKLLCLRLFAVMQSARLLQQPASLVHLGDILPGVNWGDSTLAQLAVRVAANHVVRAKVLPHPLLPSSFPAFLDGKTLPYAAINKEKAHYADSFLLVELVQPAPPACYPAEFCPGERRPRQCKVMSSALGRILLILVQSKFHSNPGQASSEAFGVEYRKCIDTPIPFIFVLISDAPRVTFEKHISWPYNGNGVFVGGEEPLRSLYGSFLYNIRAEAWLQ